VLEIRCGVVGEVLSCSVRDKRREGKDPVTRRHGLTMSCVSFLEDDTLNSYAIDLFLPI
jgi:hypothetical protein